MKIWNGLTSTVFYARRDERTVTLVDGGVLAQARIQLSMDSDEAITFAGQLTFLLMVNLNARWCRNIRIVSPDSPLHPDLAKFFGFTCLSGSQSLARAIDPFGEFEWNSDKAFDDDERVKVHVGRSGSPGSYLVMGRGWRAAAGPSVTSQPLTGDERNPLGAALAAAIGTCYTMRQSIGHTNIFADTKLSLWNWSEDEEAIDGLGLAEANLGRVLIVGTGAIGSSIAYLLPLLKRTPDYVVLIDHDDVDYPNLNRAPVFLANDVGQTKVTIVAEHLRKTGIPAYDISNRFDGSQVKMSDFDLVVPAANESAARQAIMNNVPPVMISASTGSQWDVYRQRHIPLHDDCLICRFPIQEEAPALVCATGELGTSSETKVAGMESEHGGAETGALPFLSLAGAVMACADIAKLNLDGYLKPINSTSLWFRSPSLCFTNSQKTPVTGCSYCLPDSVVLALNKTRLYK